MHKVSPSQLWVWSNCSQAWHLGYVENLKKKKTKQRFFEVGNYFHELAHVYYQALMETKKKPGDPFLLDYMLSRVRRDLESATEENINILATVSKMIGAYVQQWSPIIDKDITVLGVEQNLQVEVTLPSGATVILNCITDLIYRDKQGNLRIRDHKTGQAQGWNEYMIPLENQLLFNSLAYFRLTGQLALHVEISWINSYEYKSKQPRLDERFKLYPYVHTQHSIEFYEKELLALIDRMVTQERPVRQYSKDCAKCQFNEICVQELRGFDTKSLKRSKYEKVTRDYEVRPKFISGESGAVQAPENPKADENSFKLHIRI